MTGINKTDENKTVIQIIMDVPGCDDGSVVVVVGWASSLVFRVFLVEVPACDDGSLVR